MKALSTTLALNDVIDAALAELDQAALEARVHNDPLEKPFSALSAFLQAQRRMYADAVAVNEAARQPVRDDDLRRAVIQGVSVHGRALTRALEWRNVMIAAGLLIVALLIGAGGGFWWASTRAAQSYANLPSEYNVAMKNQDAAKWLNLMRKNTQPGALDHCSNAYPTSGGKACSFTLWTEPPSAPQ